ncbi:lipid A ethanolaminephosphotransferase [Candidatus Pantoea symbiotica]|jgi:lipid A ethanolaminephosphotransferase|uniref:Lipid A ethanolaminephosphotransferase n=1 Tax=Candidatus Pantoea symbiotica TaxID=1884370 RepID=A0A1I3QJS6_9GAMM|nr:MULTISPECIES: phosphoethanolamine transferase EptA [Pantoea]KAJ9433284.1 phosphoethanolamine transferase EptA [Pantoea sp. YR343]SFJ34373.1 lipid A ethanolaminephosphotransferase [Pantoea symbiotica]SFU32504.1 lipid A ethanolaminephosphotransferase [Pantoea sp. YR525]
MRFPITFQCGTNGFNLIAALFFALVLNALFLLRAWEMIPYDHVHDYLFAASIPLVLASAFYFLFSLAAWPYLRKPLLIALVLVSAAANYFMHSFGTVIDTNMIQNVFESDPQEAGALISSRYLLWMLLMGMVPVVLICGVRINNGTRWWWNLLQRLTGALGAILIILLMAALFYKDYASLIRNNKNLIKMITPANVVSGTGHYVDQRYLQGSQELVKIGEDAYKGPLISAATKKTLVVLVVGETARAENFSLGGYARDTNPELKKQQVIYYPNATSCGTETAISVPCMFSNMPRVHYDANLAHHQEGVLDILAHAGVSVLWRENDGGCKGACDRVPHTDMTQWKLPQYCHDGFCQDDVLLHRLDNYFDSLHNDGIIVLHQMGSHGPAYYQRYPAEFRRFTPTCDSKQIQDCDHQALVNTYDNSLLYTDDMLSRTIDKLKGLSDRFNVALVYLSDHGESLGERGMYLHGAPYMFAPSQQTHIPLLMWMSPGYAAANHINEACVRQQAVDAKVSQDNLFHTLLGMFNIQTQQYQPQLDMNRSCQTAA